MDIVYSYIKKRYAFGRQPLFCEQGPEMCDSILPNRAEQKLFILRNPVHEATQHTLPFSQHEINTIRAEYTTTGVNHAEGGWPKDVNELDPEATQRYRRRVEKDDDYIHCISAATPGLEHYVMQNNAIEMYETYYKEMSPMPPLEKNVMRTTNVYRDPECRPVSSICWQPYGGVRFAVSYVNMDFYRTPSGSTNAYLWDVDTPSTPCMTFMPPAILLDFQFNLKDNQMLIGGLVTGQVALFDVRQPVHVGICPPHMAHRDMVRNVRFISSKSGMEFFSGGPDGALKWWDARNLSEPTDEMIIDVVKYTFDVASMVTANGISVLEYEHTIPTRFMVGTDNGLVINGNRKGKTALEKLPAQYIAHTGSVRSLERSPFFVKNFLTVGDWRLLIWTEECRDSPVIATPPMRHKITAATWSPTRCSMLLCTSENGFLSAWDLLRRHYKPVITMHLCDEPLVKLSIQQNGTSLAVGSKKGKVVMVELSDSMTQSDKNDKALMTALFEREAKREKILEARLREIKLKLRQAEEGSPRHSTGDIDPTIGDRDLIEAGQDYMNIPLFCEQGPEMCDSILPNPAEHKLFILRNPVHEPTQHTLPFSQHEMNTIRAEYTTTGVNHAEGGWPKDVNELDPEATQRYRRRIEKDDDYIHCINTTAPGLEHYVMQNNAIDLYQTYYTEMSPMPPLDKNVMRTTNVYRDPEDRPVSSICWQPYGGLRFAVSYVNMDFYRTPSGSTNAYLWDVETPSTPCMTFMPPAILLDLQFNPKDNQMLIGGLVTGQVALFDVRQPVHVGICPPHVAHRDMVRNVLFINSKSGMEFFSGGTDGACKWWDVRNLSEPTDVMIIDVVKYSFDVANMATANGISVMEYENTIPTRFMVGTDNGLVIGGNRKGKTALEQLPAQYEAHTGSVGSLQRNPYFLKNFLTVGDWRLLIWSEDCRDSPVISTPPMRHKITAATWSPTRCSMLLSTGANGVLSAWDLLRCQYKPVTTMHLCDEPLVKLSIQQNGTLVTVGSKKGKIIMVELSENMTQSDKNDKGLMTAIFERESKREKILEARLREIRLKQRQAEESSPRHSTGEIDPTVGDRDLIEAGQDYMNAVKKEMSLF